MTSYFPGEPVSVPVHPLSDISVVTSSPCRTTGFGCVVITVLYKHISIYLLTARLLGMPLGHPSAENLNEDTIMMLIIKPVELTTLPQCGKEEPDE